MSSNTFICVGGFRRILGGVICSKSDGASFLFLFSNQIGPIRFAGANSETLAVSVSPPATLIIHLVKARGELETCC